MTVTCLCNIMFDLIHCTFIHKQTCVWHLNSCWCYILLYVQFWPWCWHMHKYLSGQFRILRSLWRQYLSWRLLSSSRCPSEVRPTHERNKKKNIAHDCTNLSFLSVLQLFCVVSMYMYVCVVYAVVKPSLDIVKCATISFQLLIEHHRWIVSLQFCKHFTMYQAAKSMYSNSWP